MAKSSDLKINMELIKFLWKRVYFSGFIFWAILIFSFFKNGKLALFISALWFTYEVYSLKKFRNIIGS